GSDRQRIPNAWTIRDHVAAAAAFARSRPAAAGAWRAVEPRIEHHRLHRLVAGARAERDRAATGEPVCTVRTCANDAELPALAFGRDGRGADCDGCALSRRRAHAFVIREFRGEPPYQPRSQTGGGLPSAALRGAYS